jgi:hypothetical protein
MDVPTSFGQQDVLFLISRSGVPRHWTTSVNNADTTQQVRANEVDYSGRQRTIISHSDICDNLLQNRLPLHVLLVLGLGGLKFCTEFLRCR